MDSDSPNRYVSEPNLYANDPNRHVSELAERWWMLVVRGVAGILFGVITLWVPASGLLALLIFWGMYALIDGIFALMQAYRRGRAGQSWGWLLFEGVLGLGAGVLTFVWPGITALALLTVIGVWAVMTGVAEIATAIRLRRQITGEWLLATSGALSIVFGILLLFFPGIGALALLWSIGVYAMVFGVLLIGLGVRLRRWQRTTPGARTDVRPFPMGGAPTTS